MKPTHTEESLWSLVKHTGFWMLWIWIFGGSGSRTLYLFQVPQVVFYSTLVTASQTNVWDSLLFLLFFNGYLYVLLEKAMAPHSSTLAWKIPWTEEPSRLQAMGSLRVRHNWATSLSLFTFMHWRRKWQPTPVFLSGESQGQGSLVGCRLWGRTESDTTEAT